MTGNVWMLRDELIARHRQTGEAFSPAPIAEEH